MEHNPMWAKLYYGLLERNVMMYTHGTYEQYGLTEEAALEIVANITRLEPSVLVEMKKTRDMALVDQVSNANDTVINSMGLR